ncbi:DUF2783 domain-containing protein [Yanghanlia caeni]|uniref:DUF2783 domain-containing protein n=1 Tax=Yanghanlia caeni TaxID=3064283 RepID=A0ABU1D2L8_9BURK|nr:DUF2783 domain-containing protein [Alcaligenaceae bacterium LG-2]NGR07832.1 DUF2783 domain-containing protein [bacterium SGD-2]HZH56633.1 DUF2783 domain-containing protein [Burkholderiaceae bacterium]
MSQLNTQSNFNVPDAFYERLISAHRDLTTNESNAMNAALVLLLSNHIGDLNVISQALDEARRSVMAEA